MGELPGRGRLSTTARPRHPRSANTPASARAISLARQLSARCSQRHSWLLLPGCSLRHPAPATRSQRAWCSPAAPSTAPPPSLRTAVPSRLASRGCSALPHPPPAPRSRPAPTPPRLPPPSSPTRRSAL
eukprot:2704426-Rhodomonas_salina.2